MAREHALATGLAAAAPRRGASAPEEEAGRLPETAEAEFVSLEDADAEAQGKKTADGERG